MKKAVVIPSFLAFLAIAVCVGPWLLAQGQDRGGANPVRGTKVAIVNIRAVLKENARAKGLQAELDEDIKPYKFKAQLLKDEIDKLAAADNSRPVERKTNVIAIQIKTKAWEKVNNDIVQLIEEKHKTKLPLLWSEVDQAIEAIAKAYGFQLVLGTANPEDAEVAAFHGIKPNKLRTTDMGCTVANYVHGSVDITPVVIEMLKRNLQPRR